MAALGTDSVNVPRGSNTRAIAAIQSANNLSSAIFALARGTETIRPVDVIAGPGNAWVQAAKREVFGEVAIDYTLQPIAPKVRIFEIAMAAVRSNCCRSFSKLLVARSG